MSIRTLFLSAGLLVIVCGGALSQPTPRPSPRPATPPPPLPPPDGLSVVPPGLPLPPPPPPPPAQKSVEELLTELENIRAQKAELERKEKELKALIGKKLEDQTERLKKLGIAPPAAKEKEPDRVGRIIIEGNIKTPDRRIHEKLELQPGQILQYPKLEEARARLAKMGFREVTVEVLPNEFDSIYKDIRVRVVEKDAR